LEARLLKPCGFPVLHWLQRLMAKHVFACTDSQNGVWKKELFILWVALRNKAMNIEAFIAAHLEEQAQSAEVVVTRWVIITIIAQPLGFSWQVDNSSILYTLGHIDIAICINMKLFAHTMVANFGFTIMVNPSSLSPPKTNHHQLPFQPHT